MFKARYALGLPLDPMVIPLVGVLTCQLDRANACIAPTAVWVSQNGDSIDQPLLLLLVVKVVVSCFFNFLLLDLNFFLF